MNVLAQPIDEEFALSDTEAGLLAGAMAVIAGGYLWAAVHFLFATRSLQRELALPLQCRREGDL